MLYTASTISRLHLMQTHWEAWNKLHSKHNEKLCWSNLKIPIAFQSHYKLGVMKKRQKVRTRCVCLFGEVQLMSVIMVHSELYISNCHNWMPFINVVGNSMCFIGDEINNKSTRWKNCWKETIKVCAATENAALDQKSLISDCFLSSLNE